QACETGGSEQDGQKHMNSGAARERRNEGKGRRQRLRSDDNRGGEVKRQPGVAVQQGAGCDLDPAERQTRHESSARAMHCQLPWLAALDWQPARGGAHESVSWERDFELFVTMRRNSNPSTID